MFNVWLARADQLRRAKRAVKPLLIKKFVKLRKLAFKTLQRQTYLDRVCALLH